MACVFLHIGHSFRLLMLRSLAVCLALRWPAAAFVALSSDAHASDASARETCERAALRAAQPSSSDNDCSSIFHAERFCCEEKASAVLQRCNKEAADAPDSQRAYMDCTGPFTGEAFRCVDAAEKRRSSCISAVRASQAASEHEKASSSASSRNVGSDNSRPTSKNSGSTGTRTATNQSPSPASSNTPSQPQRTPDWTGSNGYRMQRIPSGTMAVRLG